MRRLIISNLLRKDANILEHLIKCLSVVSERNCAVMRVILLDQYMTVESAHLLDRKYTDGAEGFRRNGKDFSLRHISAQNVIRR